MMAMFSPWWAQRTGRERVLVGLMLVLLAALLFWLLLVRPLAAARATAQADAAAASTRLANGQALAAAVVELEEFAEDLAYQLVTAFDDFVLLLSVDFDAKFL